MTEEKIATYKLLNGSKSEIQKILDQWEQQKSSTLKMIYKAAQTEEMIPLTRTEKEIK